MRTTLLVFGQVIASIVLWMIFGWQAIGIIAIVALLRIFINEDKKKKGGGA